MKAFILALQLMTRLPVKKEIPVTDERLIRGIVYWPFVGVIVGALDCLVFALLSFLLPKSAAAAFAVLCQLCVTGGFHLDGLCDTADGIYSARSRERMLEIMKDSRIGTNGVIAAVFDIGLKILAFAGLENPIPAILLAPVAGKCIQGILIYKSVYPRERGLGAAYVGKIPAAVMAGCLVCGLVLVELGLFLAGYRRLLCAPLIFVAAAVVYRFYIHKKLGGMTGDTLGAGNELCELVFVLTLLVGQRFGL